MLVLAGCGQAATPTPQPTATVQPPTATLPPTATSLPTATLPPTATSLPTLLPPTAGQVQALDMAAIESDLKQGFAKGFITGNYAYFVPWNWSTFVKLLPLPNKVVRVDLDDFAPHGATVLDLKAGSTNGIYGSFTDGRYGYFSALNNSLFRVDLQNFSDSGVTFFDLSPLDASLSYTIGAFSDGHYAYFNSYGGILSRVDLQNFDPKSVVFLDMGYFGGSTDGRYGYFSQLVTDNQNASTIARVDLQDFTHSGITILDLELEQYTVVLNGWFLNEGYFYLAPNMDGKIIRVDTRNFTPSGVTTLDLSTLDKGLYGYVSAFTDGHYGYFLPNYASPQSDIVDGSGKVARVDLSNFTASGVTWLDLTRLDKCWNNFMDGMADSHYIYLEPGDYSQSGTSLNTSVVRISLDYAGWTPLP